MKTVIITVAGISSRFNEGIPENEKVLKAVYYERDWRNTLLYHMIEKSSFADRIIVVGGYRFDSLEKYCLLFSQDILEKITIVRNEHFRDFGSGYSLYLGLEEAFRSKSEEILFAEGDLDIDSLSFEKVIESDKNVLTFNYEPIYSNKAVVLYMDDKGRYQYAFNSSHGLLSIDSSFSCIFNSGQVWKFLDMDYLDYACKKFLEQEVKDTNLRIIQNYLDKETTALLE